MAKNKPEGFLTFLRERGVVGLAIGFILGTGAGHLVSSLVEDIVTPFINLILGRAKALQTFTFTIQASEFRIGEFLMALLDFVVLAAVVYYIFRWLHLEKLDKKKGE